MADSCSPRKFEDYWNPIWLEQRTLQADRYQVLHTGTYKTGRWRGEATFFIGEQAICSREAMQMRSKRTGRDYWVVRRDDSETQTEATLADVYE